MRADPKIIDLLNDYLTIELTASTSYFGQSRMVHHWGYPHLAGKLRELALDEMRDAESTIDRILYCEGVPNLQRLGSVLAGESPKEVLETIAQSERDTIVWLNQAVATALAEGDQGTREFLAEKLTREEDHLDWLERQLDAIARLGEAIYLGEQVRG